jgi:hypothetical protein
MPSRQHVRAKGPFGGQARLGPPHRLARAGNQVGQGLQTGAAMAFADPPDGGRILLDLLAEWHDPLLTTGSALQDLSAASDPQRGRAVP